MHVHGILLSIVGKGAAGLPVDLELIGDGLQQDRVGRRHLGAVTRTRVAE